MPLLSTYARRAALGLVAAALVATVLPTTAYAAPPTCDAEPTHEIGAVQGSGSATPLAGQPVTVRGTVVGDVPGFAGFYLQDVDGDGDAATSDGIFVFSSVAVDLGDDVAVTGAAVEFGGQTQVSARLDATVCADGTADDLPEAAALDLPAGDAERERLEGMLVEPVDVLTVSEVFALTSFGELTLSEGGLAAIWCCTEPEREQPAHDDFLHKVREFCTHEGAVLIFDEMITGFRWHLGGAQVEYGVTPDISTFGKAMANGFAVSALAGRRELMQRGGITHENERVFLLSTTHGAETHALAAAIATMAVYQERDVIGRLHAIGASLRTQVEHAAVSAGVSENFRLVGRDSNLSFQALDNDGSPSQLLRTLFLQELVRRGILAPSLS